MSTKSKRRSIRRAHLEPSPEQAVRTAAAGQKNEKQVAGEIVGVLLNAITFGAVDGPPSGRTTARTQTP